MTRLFILLLAAGLVSSHRKFYRYDYTYIEEFDAFYKFHFNDNEKDRIPAFQACEDEGAELFYPNTCDEWTVVKKLDKYSDIFLNYIFVGLRDQFDNCEFSVMKVTSNRTPRWSFETFGEGSCVYLDIHTGMLVANQDCSLDSTSRPFVCKKTETVTTCPIGYQYSKETKKCYKANESRFSWCKAMESCIVQGGLLLMVESEAEATLIKDKIIVKDYWDYYIGGKKLSPDLKDYTHIATGNNQSVSGFQIHTSGYGKYDCLTIWRASEIYISSRPCNETNSFVCEKKVSAYP